MRFPEIGQKQRVVAGARRLGVGDRLLEMVTADGAPSPGRPDFIVDLRRRV
jgi:hypothetical protein